MKGVILRERRVLLLRKSDGTWDLPGGRLDIQESPRQCLVREIREETGLSVKPGRILHRWVRRRSEKTDVFVVSHICTAIEPAENGRLSDEHEALAWFFEPDLDTVLTSAGIRKSMRRAFHLQKGLK
jgi:8-oxo-dGTP pyrophosphatase MutT (NUDIX family)